MTATDNEAMSALHALLEERQRYQGWLATLESRRNSTPPHVYERVQKDYAGRLDGVMQQLADRASQLAGTIESMTTELATLRQHESDRTDERHEAELRAAVGEYSPEDWDRRRAEADADLDRIAAERHSLQSELEELQRIVALTGSLELPAEKAEAASARAEGGREASERSSGRSPERAPAQTDSSHQSIEDFVAEWHDPRGKPNVRGPAERHDHVPEAADLDGMVIPAAPMGGNPVGAAGADYGIANGVRGHAAVPPTPSGSAAPTEGVQAGGDAARRDADKTLKCPECGAMNYATEWYCEKCGGELSTF
jgi:septal ring factor EnvC (AmiA/AmiB activator)